MRLNASIQDSISRLLPESRGAPGKAGIRRGARAGETIGVWRPRSGGWGRSGALEGGRETLRPAWAAFTLLELLVVLGIIGIIASLALPAISKLSKPKGMAVATRQILDDLSYARTLALGTRSTVYFVLLPPDLTNYPAAYATNSYTQAQTNLLNELVALQFRGYALYQRRSIGDQPGRMTPRYLTEWKSLPEHIFFPPPAYTNNAFNAGTFDYADFHFPTVDSPLWTLPFVAFNSQGQLVRINAAGDEVPTQSDALVPLTEGSILTPRNIDAAYDPSAVDWTETPPGRHTNLVYRVRVNWVTGRGRIERPEL